MKTLPPFATVTLLLLASVAIVQAGPRSSASYRIVADAADDGGRRTTSANYINSGSAGLASGRANGPGGALVLESGYVAQLLDAPLQVVSAVSRKIHGGAGPFDIDLPIAGPAGIECRTGGAGGDHQVVVVFANPVTVGGVSIMSSNGMASGTTNTNGNTVTINLSAVANAQTLGITLLNVNNGSSTGNVVFQMAILSGDTNANGAVNASDVGQTKAQSGQALVPANFRSDVNVSGAINASDIGLVKASAGTQLP